MMDNDKAAGAREISEDFSELRPLHVKLKGKSKYEVLSGDANWYDPPTAHARAGDPGYEVRLPDSCGLCKATELAEKATESVSGSNPQEA